MNHKKFLISTVAIIMLVLMASSVLSAVNISGLPKMDEILYKAYPGATPDTVVSEFLTGVTDWMGGPARLDLYNSVVDAGHKISPFDAMSEFGFFAINCRDYKETAGTSNFPFNSSAFRVSLQFIYGVADKNTSIFNYLGTGFSWGIDNPVPPAQEPWYDDTIKMAGPSSNTTAWSILTTHGFYVNSTDNWVYANGTKVRDLQLLYSTGTTYWEQGPGGGFVTAFNAFIQGFLGASGPTMALTPTDFSALVSDLLLIHDYDMIAIGLTNMGIFFDWAYDMLHSDNIGPWLWNFVGIEDPIFDYYSEIILTSLNVTEVIEASSIIQAHWVYNSMPWFPVDTGSEFCTTAREADPPSGRGELMNLVSMPNYGPSNGWSWMTLHWNYSWPGGTLKRALGDEPHDMNPYYEDTLYGWQLMERAVDGLLSRQPIDLTYIPWIANKWVLSNWTSIPELGITAGSLATFYLRQDVDWQDGKPVNAYDCVNNMRLLRKYHPGRYSSTWANLVYEEADGPYKFTAYFYQTSLYYIGYVAGTALLSPKHIMDIVEEKVDTGEIATFEAWRPCELTSSYTSLTGDAPPTAYPFMKQLVGCGPYVYDYYDRSLAVGRVQKYNEFFVNAPVIGSAVGEWRIDPDTAYTYEVIAQNIAAKEDTPEGEMATVTVDVKIYVDDILAYEHTGQTLNPWQYNTYGPYTTGTLARGEHTIKVEIYESAALIHTYVHTFTATIREDISTYYGEVRDYLVDGLDIIFAARAFGSYPEHERWYVPADVNDDYICDGADLIRIARKFGWPGA